MGFIDPLFTAYHVIVHDFLKQIYSLVRRITIDLFRKAVWLDGLPPVVFGGFQAESVSWMGFRVYFEGFLRDCRSLPSIVFLL
ncbi:MAG: hypothetical protein ABSH25_16825 [Syntrophorhabdales bacterium]|jgi:hypothetical protein